MKTFQVGQTYTARSICDSNCIIRVTVASRTEKSIKTTEGKTLRVKVWNDGSCEYVKPWGSYSMAPMVQAA